MYHKTGSVLRGGPPESRKARISGNIVTGVSAATMELAHCRCPPLLNAAQMGDKRRRPILLTKRDTAEISTGRRKKKEEEKRGKKEKDECENKEGSEREREREREADIEKLKSRFHEDQQASRNSVIVEKRRTHLFFFFCDTCKRSAS